MSQTPQEDQVSAADDLLNIPDADPANVILHNNLEPVCGRCYGDGPLFPANCDEKPESRSGGPLGMYHCPDCGAMVMSGMTHQDLCQLCFDRTHPRFDLSGDKNAEK